MIDDLGDDDLVGPIHGLSHFIVIDQNETGLRGLKQIALSKDALERSVIVDDHEGVARGRAEFATCFGNGGIGVDRRYVAIDHPIKSGSGAHHPSGGRGIVWTNDYADVAFASLG